MRATYPWGKSIVQNHARGTLNAGIGAGNTKLRYAEVKDARKGRTSDGEEVVSKNAFVPNRSFTIIFAESRPPNRGNSHG